MRYYFSISLLFFVLLTSGLLFSQSKSIDTKKMNEALNLIHSRKSVRTFSDKEVSKQDIEIVLKAAMCAPSSKNNQPWLFYVIRNRELLKKLAEELPYAKSLEKVSVAIVICGDNTKGVVEPDQSLNWALDCSAASQNLLLAAESIGLGATWTGVFPYKARVEVVQNLLNLPENIIPLNAIPIGYPAGQEKPKNKFKPENIKWID